MNSLPLLLAARGGVPWPVVIFFVVVAIQVAAGLWRHLRRKGGGRYDASEPTALEPIPGHDWRARPSTGFPQHRGGAFPANRTTARIPPAFDDAERQRRLERQLRGGGNWRGGPPPIPATTYVDAEQSPEFAPEPSGRLASLSESATALNEAQRRLTHAAAASAMGLPGLHEAGGALKSASQRLAQAGESVLHPTNAHAVPARADPSGPSLPEQLNQTLRDPASARGAVITALLLGKPKALEDFP